jgi:hypothetical protein
MMGTQPAPVPPLSQSSSIDRDIYSAPPVNFVNSQSAMVMPSSASEQSVSAMAENGDPDKKGTHNRSVSEPDFKRQQVVLLFCCKAYNFLRSPISRSFFFDKAHFKILHDHSLCLLIYHFLNTYTHSKYILCVTCKERSTC